MKLQFRNILLPGLIAVSLLGACKEDFLDEGPSTAIDASKALVSEYDVLSALRGTYSGLNSSTLYGQTLPVIGDLLGDNTFVSSSNSGYFTFFNGYSLTRTDGDVAGIWNQAYSVIQRANRVINSNPEGGTPATINQYKGEAYAIRGLMYFELVRHFGKPYTEDPSAPGVPIVTEFNIDSEPARNTVGEVYAQILSDLDKAYELMTQNAGTSRFSKYAARAVAAKVNLTKGDADGNAKALEYAEEVINNSGYQLLPLENVVGFWAEPKPNTNKVETLFEVVATETDNNGVDELAYIYSQTGYGQNLATKGLYDLYSATDVRKELIQVGARPRAESPAYIVTKFKNVGGDRDDKKVIRISDVYLIAAEAAYKTNDEGKARTYLNDLVEQRDPSLTYTSAGTQLFDDIILERRKELAFEGDRFHTLNRLKLDITGRGKTPLTVAYGSTKRVLPIPQTELDANKNMTPNPGY